MATKEKDSTRGSGHWWMGPAEAAKYVGCAEKTMRGLIASREIRSVPRVSARLSGDGWRILNERVVSRDDVDEWMYAGENIGRKAVA